MSARAFIVTGGAIITTAVAGFAIYIWNVGLEDADRLASVLSLFVGLVGLALAGHGLLRGDAAEKRHLARSSINIGGDGLVQQGEINTNINMGEGGTLRYERPDQAT